MKSYKIISFTYMPKDTPYPRPTAVVETRRLFFFKERFTYICREVGAFRAVWLCKETGEELSTTSRLYDMLNNTGRREQLHLCP